FVKKGTGWPVKGNVDGNLAEKVNEYNPDLIVILDKSDVDDEFFDEVNSKIIWLDHHLPVENPRCLYLNPQVNDKNNNLATSYWAYKISKNDLWLAVVGIVSDWQMPPKDIAEEFYSKYSNLLSRTIKKPKEALFNSEIGKLAKIFSFNLKARRSDILSSIKILSRIEDPYEILNGETAQSKLILKRFEKHELAYNKLMEQINVDDGKMIVFKYDSNENSYTTDLSNDLLNKHPDKLIIIARKSGNSYKCSLRSEKFPVRKILENILAGIGGTGGGHPQACGAVISEENFETFVELFKNEVESI
ncbi:MAG: DHH family phosphoesterase, partial [Candidatus Woesearchaeota archaeon]